MTIIIQLIDVLNTPISVQQSIYVHQFDKNQMLDLLINSTYKSEKQKYAHAVHHGVNNTQT